MESVSGLARWLLAEGIHNHTVDGNLSVTCKAKQANLSKRLETTACINFSKEWLEVFLADDVVHAWSQQDPRVPFIAVAV